MPENHVLLQRCLHLQARIHRISDTELDHVDVESLMYQQNDQVLCRAELLNFLQDAGSAMCRVNCTSEKQLITLDGGRAAVACVNYKGPTQLTTKNNADYLFLIVPDSGYMCIRALLSYTSSTTTHEPEPDTRGR